MATDNDKKKTNDAADRAQSYDAALAKYATAVAALRKGKLDDARATFEEIERENPDEPELIERARMYRRVCEQRATSDPAEPTDADGYYRSAVVLANQGKLEEARERIERALTDQPRSASYLYVRASIHALDGKVTESVSDLRQALAADPAVRFQAVNDPDFERIREEPAFIDVIEPTPTGA